MRYVVIFEDSAEMAAVRAAHEPAHLQYLDAHRDEIPMAGGLRDEHGAAVYAGGLWVFDVPSKQRAVDLIQADPYYQAHPRLYRLLAWGKALPQYQVLM
ncbi:MAG: YciI family protein [Burkholderiaceae bacterium]